MILTDFNASSKIEYLSPEVGYLSKVEYFDDSRDLLFSLELSSFEYDKKDNEPDDEKPEEKEESTNIPFYIFLDILLFIVLIIIIVLMKLDKRRHERMLMEKLENLKNKKTAARSLDTIKGQVKITCPKCKNTINVVGSQKHSTIRCPHCGAVGDVKT
jgi:rubrerythrin